MRGGALHPRARPWAGCADLGKPCTLGTIRRPRAGERGVCPILFFTPHHPVCTQRCFPGNCWAPGTQDAVQGRFLQDTHTIVPFVADTIKKGGG